MCGSRRLRRTTWKAFRLSGLSKAQQPRTVLAIVGPTAAGKSDLAMRVATEIGAEIVSIDSGAVYRGMDLGTAKPSREDQARIVHHMIDCVDPSQNISVAQFQSRARLALEQIAERGKTPLLAGGSGLYFRAVVDPLEFPPTDPATRRRLAAAAGRMGIAGLHHLLVSVDPAAAARIPLANERRIIRALEVVAITGKRFSDFGSNWDEFESMYPLRVAGLSPPRPELDRRIESRVDRLFEGGLVGEVESLIRKGYKASVTAVQALGYAQVLEYLEGRISLEKAIADTKSRTRRFARRQLTWFRADPRVEWFAEPEGAFRALIGALN